MQISMTVNGASQQHDVEPRTLLVQFLREACGLTGTKIGCDTSSCGACTVLVDGESVKSCTMFAAQADGAEITHHRGTRDRRRAASGPTGVPREPRPAVRVLHGRMVMAAVSFLEENPAPTERDVRLGLEGNLCRCTGYHNIVKGRARGGRARCRRAPRDPRGVRVRPGRRRPTRRSRCSPSTATTPSSSRAGCRSSR